MPDSLRPAILFAEDFDMPSGITVLDDPSVAEKPDIAPITPQELEAARENAYAEGLKQGLAQAAADRAEVTRQMLDAISRHLQNAKEEAGRVADESARTLAQLLLGVLGTMLPATCAHHGEAEARAVVQTVLPALVREPQVVVRVSPLVADAVSAELENLDSEVAGSVSLVPAESIPPGDVRISWTDGQAIRDTQAIWKNIADTLAPLDLLAAESLDA